MIWRGFFFQIFAKISLSVKLVLAEALKKLNNIYQGMFLRHSSLQELHVVCEKRDQVKGRRGAPTGMVTGFQTKSVTHQCFTPLESWEMGDVGLGAC